MTSDYIYISFQVVKLFLKHSVLFKLGSSLAVLIVNKNGIKLWTEFTL
jgi:hypothetical protein